MRRTIPFLFFVGSLLVASCEGPGEGKEEARVRPELRAEVHALRVRTIPPGGDCGQFSLASLSTQSGIEASWEIMARMTWESYRDYLNGQLGGDFESASTSNREATFARLLSGDNQSLSVEVVSSAVEPLRVRIRFRSVPS